MHKANTYCDEEQQPYSSENSSSHRKEQIPTETERKALHFFERGTIVYFFLFIEEDFLFQVIPQELFFTSKLPLPGFVVWKKQMISMVKQIVRIVIHTIVLPVDGVSLQSTMKMFHHGINNALMLRLLF